MVHQTDIVKECLINHWWSFDNISINSWCSVDWLLDDNLSSWLLDDDLSNWLLDNDFSWLLDDVFSSWLFDNLLRNWCWEILDGAALLEIN